MKIRLKSVAGLCLLFAGVGLILTLSTAMADIPGNHPHYIEALANLRAARWVLNHPEEWTMEHDAQAANDRINKAIAELKRASIDDGKDINDHPPADANLDQRGRFHHAHDYLQAALNDLGFEEDNRAALGWRRAAREHIQEAIRRVDAAILAHRYR